MISPLEFRSRALANGFAPIPLNGKRPIMDGWQKRTETTPQEIELWDRTRPAERNTGYLTRSAPTFDIDILDEDAAAAIEQLVRERFEELGIVLVRFGSRPKRAIPFCTSKPFPKIKITFAGEAEEKLELLCDGQQLAADGAHPDTHRPYEWFGGSPADTARVDLPAITEGEARALVADAARLLCENFGYQAKPTKSKSNGAGKPNGAATDWSFTPDDLIDHDRLVALAARFIKAGMNPAAVKNFLRQGVEGLTEVDEERRTRRLGEIPGIVDSAEALDSGPQPDHDPPRGVAPDERAPAFSDEALALSFAQRHGAGLRYVADWNKWMSWTGTHWRPDSTLHAYDEARRIAREAAAKCNKAKEAKMIASSKTVAAIEKLSKADRRIAGATDQWDLRLNLLNVPTIGE